MKHLTLATMALLGMTAAADEPSNEDIIVLTPPESATGDDVAIVWIHGANCDTKAYTEFANNIQSQGADDGKKVWVGLPTFLFDIPEPLLIDQYVKSTIKQLRQSGFEGNNILLAGHSLGGVMAQNYAKDHADEIKGQILMGSVITRDKHSLNEDGSTHFDYEVPTLSIGGTKDGLMRVSRLAEAYWHSVKNIEPEQANMFPVFALEGTSHMSYMTGEAPSFVKNKDLVADLEEGEAKNKFGAAIVQFMDQVMKSDFREGLSNDSEAVLHGLIEAMEMEGSYQLKPPCYGHDFDNPHVPTCWHGSPWSSMMTQNIMGGEFDNENISVINDDNFHRVQSVTPVHLPHFANECEKDTSQLCELKTFTVSEAKYDFLDQLDTGFYPISASEIKTKISSRQAVQAKAGYKNNFHDTDETGNRCAEINEQSIKWAYERLSPAAKKNYDQFGQKYVVGDDKGPYNAGPLWIWTFMEYKESADKKTVTVQAPMMRTPLDYLISSAAGFHYCKVLSPFKVMEWMYTDSLFEFNGIKNAAVEEELTFLQ